MGMAILLPCVLLIAPEEWVVKETRGPVTFQARGPASPVSLADQLVIRVTVVRPPQAHVEAPLLTAPATHARLAATNSFGPDATGPFLSQAWQFHLEPLRPGKIELLPVRIKYRLEGEEAQEVELAMPTIEVINSEGASADPETLRPMPRLGAPYWTTGRILTAAGVGVFVATLLLAILPLRRRHSAEHDRQQALSELTLLEEGELVDQKRFREAIVELAGTLRRYMEARYRLKAGTMTTPEFLSHTRTTRALKEDSQWRMERLLPLVDVEKFGPGRPTETDFLQLLDLARTFLESEASR